MKQKDILLLLILSTIVTILWIVSNIKHNIDTSTISDTLGIQIQPIVGSFDSSTIQRLKKRIGVTPSYTLNISSTSKITPTPAIATNAADLDEATPTATPENQISLTPTSSVTQPADSQ